MSALTIAPDTPHLSKSQLVQQIRSGQLTLAELTAERPDALSGTTLFAIALTLPGFGQRRLTALNRRAVANDINLAVTLGGASGRTLVWLLREICDQDATLGDDENPDAVHVGEADVPERSWETIALSLDSLILEHERDVCDESLPAERWATADERIHRSRAQVMAHAPVRDPEPA